MNNTILIVLSNVNFIDSPKKFNENTYIIKK